MSEKNSPSVQEKVIELLRERLPTNHEVRLEHEFVSDLALDSIDVIQLALEVEDALEITVPDEIVDSFKTVRDLVDYAEQEVGKFHGS
jgi:acyl carrier protein